MKRLPLALLSVLIPTTAWAQPAPPAAAPGAPAKTLAPDPAAAPERIAAPPASTPPPATTAPAGGDAPSAPVVASPPDSTAGADPTAGAHPTGDAHADVVSGATPLEDEEQDHDYGLAMEVGEWMFRPYGYVRMGFEWVNNDERYDFIGENSGFVLDAARLGFEVKRADEFTAVISVEGADGNPSGINTPAGDLDVRLRDAYMRWDPIPQIGVQVGQFFAPFAAEEMVSRRDLAFAGRALAQEGVLSGRGFEQSPVALDRQLGVMISQRDPIDIGPVGLAAYAMIANGNGPNKLLNDNNLPAFIGRLELYAMDHVRAGGAFARNDRREGEAPDQFDEKDTSFAADLLVTIKDLRVFGQFVQVMTEFPTAGLADRTQRGISAEAGYTLKVPYVHITPGYRFAHFDPWAGGSEAAAGAALESFQLNYHTVGLRFDHADLPFRLYANYTITVERDPRKLDNDRLQILTQAEF